MIKQKLNKYLYVKEYNNDVICLNMQNKNIITFTIDKFNYILKNKDNLNIIKQERPHLFSLLVKTGLIINDTTNEIDSIRFEYQKVIFNDKLYRLTLIPTMDCNYNCWYCYETKHKSSMNKAVRNNVIKHVHNKILYENISGVALDWFGGEPLMYFNEVLYPLSKEILQQCNKNKRKFSNQITTNGFLFNELIINKLEEIQLKNFQITLDGNEYYHEKVKRINGAYKKTIDNINALCHSLKDVEIILRINFTDENIDSTIDIIKDIPVKNRHKIKVSFQRVWQLKDNNKYYYSVDKIKEVYAREGFRLENYKMSMVQTCYADRLEQAVINYDGNIFKCTARDFTKENRDGYLDSDGDIIWDQEKYTRRLGKFRFDNEKCYSCDLLPMCYGPCSQKVIETPESNIDRICNYDGLKITIEEMLMKNYNEIIKESCS